MSSLDPMISDWIFYVVRKILVFLQYDWKKKLFGPIKHENHMPLKINSVRTEEKSNIVTVLRFELFNRCYRQNTFSIKRPNQNTLN